MENVLNQNLLKLVLRPRNEEFYLLLSTYGRRQTLSKILSKLEGSTSQEKERDQSMLREGPSKRIFARVCRINVISLTIMHCFKLFPRFMDIEFYLCRGGTSISILNKRNAVYVSGQKETFTGILLLLKGPILLYSKRIQQAV